MDKQRILVVDDTPANVKVLSDLLREHYHISVATNGPEALDLAESDNRPDLILLDIMMPEMDGYEVCGRLKANKYTHDIPVIFITAKTEMEDEIRGFNLGAVDYIFKPFCPPIVKSRVKSQLALKRDLETIKSQRDMYRYSPNLAEEVQQGLLPRESPRLRGVDIAGHSCYCDEAGGDYFDFIEIESPQSGRMVIALGDVTGRGVPSALHMASVRSALRLRFSLSGELGPIVFDVNRNFYNDVHLTGQFITLFLGIVDASKRKLEWVSAGHDPAIVYDIVNDRFDSLDDEVGLPLGVADELKLTPLHRNLPKDHIIVIGTDGIWDAQNENGETFGKERLQNVIRQNCSLSARGMIEAVLESVEMFIDPMGKKDDMTMVVVKT